jgi:ribosomal protein L16/L10AE
MVKRGDVLLEIRSFDIKLSKNVLNAARVKFPLKTLLNNKQQR